jgi:GT2 family glycosyltransferase
MRTALSLKIAVIIPTHNRVEMLCRCITSVLESGYDALTIFVVDDGSTDGTSGMLSVNFPQVHIIHGDGSLWWSGSVNVGIIEALLADIDYILLLNDDVVIDTKAISSLVQCARDNPKSIIGSMIYDKSNPSIIWSAGVGLRWPWPGEFTIGHGENDNGQYDGVRSVASMPGMGTFISRTVVDRIGLFDEKCMPQYLADIDFPLRAKKAGFPALVTSDSKVYNSLETTGGLDMDCKRLTWHDAFWVFTNYKSSEYVPARFMFMRRHCPVIWLFPAFFIRYFRLFVYIVKRYPY